MAIVIVLISSIIEYLKGRSKNIIPANYLVQKIGNKFNKLQVKVPKKITEKGLIIKGYD